MALNWSMSTQMSVSGSTARLRLVKYEGNMRLCTQQMNGSKLNRWLQNDKSSLMVSLFHIIFMWLIS